MGVNKKNIDLVIEQIENEDVPFDMSIHQFNCGSPACICGHANALAFKDKNTKNPTSLNDDGAACDFLGVSVTEVNFLFYPLRFKIHGNYFDPMDDDIGLQRKLAINTLKHLRDTGTVDWEVANAGIDDE